MARDPFGSEIPLALRSAATIGMGVAGLVFGMFGVRSFRMPWTVAIPVGIIAAIVLGLLAWRSPETFFKNRR